MNVKVKGVTFTFGTAPNIWCGIQDGERLTLTVDGVDDQDMRSFIRTLSDLELLTLSCYKWVMLYRLADARSGPHDMGSGTCALCIGKGGCLNGCPIRCAVGNEACYGTPYPAYAHSRLDALESRYTPRAAARKEAMFLIGLRRMMKHGRPPEAYRELRRERYWEWH